MATEGVSCHAAHSFSPMVRRLWSKVCSSTVPMCTDTQVCIYTCVTTGAGLGDSHRVHIQV